ncbi:M48 family metallopeptidase [Fulvivirga maritima]|uniref:M48 family metalloprotease n=1 Tax=Fulvivirga maritima TaxID=2904247 RepID=UPI001F33FBA6|nr:M48 family metallopeptidase [Fulvivirga maritima]UII24898.1 M48 family metallopeptidase [Fulvivirga maritima]
MAKREIRISSEFKAQTTKAILSIVLFIFAYVLMLALAVGLTALCVYGGIMLIIARPMFFTIAFGSGLASLGVLVLIFLLKFIFKSHKVDRSHLFEISKADEPELFNLISDIVKQVGTSFPKKVYLSSDVNASVFYNSNFWSMFLPTKKNLQIGLGLVNTVSKAEFTAILSHEFGHFSQKTMKVGSYFYNVNQVIYNLLYDNESYDNLIQRWGSISGYFTIFVVLAVKINEGVQWVLRAVYGVVNKSNMGLSREMEFHADEIAASVTGFEPLKTSLLRMSIADYSFNYVLSFYDARIASNQKSENIYKEHLYVMNFLAENNNMKIENGLPQITVEELGKFNKSKLVIKDQWASHPSTEDRIEMLEKTGVLTQQTESMPANSIFTDIIETQKALTDKIFKGVHYEGKAAPIPFEEFQKEYRKEYRDNTFSKIYNGYYDDKNPSCFDVSASESSDKEAAIDELFSSEMVDTVYTAIALRNDIETLRQIAEKAVPIKTFDYDGKKYKKKDCKELIDKLGKELSLTDDQITQNDIRIYHFFRQCEVKSDAIPILEYDYKKFFNYDKEFDSKFEPYTKLTNALQFVNQTTPFDGIQANFRRIEPIEAELKNGIKELLADSIYETELTKEIKDNFELYNSKKWQYFGNEKYFDDNLNVLFTALNNYAFLLSKGYFLLKKELLDYQVKLLKATDKVYSQ